MGDLRIATELPHLGGSDLLVAIGIGPGTALPPVGGHGANPVSDLPIAMELPQLGGSDLQVAMELARPVGSGRQTAIDPINPRPDQPLFSQQTAARTAGRPCLAPDD